MRDIGGHHRHYVLRLPPPSLDYLLGLGERDSFIHARTPFSGQRGATVPSTLENATESQHAAPRAMVDAAALVAGVDAPNDPQPLVIQRIRLSVRSPPRQRQRRDLFDREHRTEGRMVMGKQPEPQGML